MERRTKQKIEVVPLPDNFIREANNIKATRTGPAIVEREERPRGPARPSKRYRPQPAGRPQGARSGGHGGRRASSR